MQCPFCGFARPGQERLCPSCGRALAAPGSAKAAPPPPKVGKGAIRLVVYSSLVFGMSQGFSRLCSSYLDAQQEQAESALMQQLLEQKRRMREVSVEPESIGDSGQAEKSAPERGAAAMTPDSATETAEGISE